MSEAWFLLGRREGKGIWKECKRDNNMTNNASQIVIFENNYWNKEKFKVFHFIIFFITHNILINFKLMNSAATLPDVILHFFRFLKIQFLLCHITSLKYVPRGLKL